MNAEGAGLRESPIDVTEGNGESQNRCKEGNSERGPDEMLDFPSSEDGCTSTVAKALPVQFRRLARKSAGSAVGAFRPRVTEANGFKKRGEVSCPWGTGIGAADASKAVSVATTDAPL